MVPELVVYSECLLLSIINLSIINYALMKRLKKHEDRPDVGTWLRQRILQKKQHSYFSLKARFKNVVFCMSLCVIGSLCDRGVAYFRTTSSLPILMNAAMALSSCSRV